MCDRDGAHASPTPPAGAAADWTVPQRWDELTAEDHWVWDTLFARQQTLLHGRAVEAFEQGLDVLHLSRPGVPNFDELNEKLHGRTGWTVVAVPGLVPDDVFFRHLSERRFPAGNFIRAADQLDYLEEPDVFHDVFGHVPLLARFDINQVLRTRYRTDAFQQGYFVIEHFRDVLGMVTRNDLTALYAALDQLPDLDFGPEDAQDLLAA